MTKIKLKIQATEHNARNVERGAPKTWHVHVCEELNTQMGHFQIVKETLFAENNGTVLWILDVPVRISSIKQFQSDIVQTKCALLVAWQSWVPSQGTSGTFVNANLLWALFWHWIFLFGGNKLLIICGGDKTSSKQQNKNIEWHWGDALPKGLEDLLTQIPDTKLSTVIASTQSLQWEQWFASPLMWVFRKALIQMFWKHCKDVFPHFHLWMGKENINLCGEHAMTCIWGKTCFQSSKWCMRILWILRLCETTQLTLKHDSAFPFVHKTIFVTLPLQESWCHLCIWSRILRLTRLLSDQQGRDFSLTKDFWPRLCQPEEPDIWCQRWHWWLEKMELDLCLDHLVLDPFEGVNEVCNGLPMMSECKTSVPEQLQKQHALDLLFELKQLLRYAWGWATCSFFSQVNHDVLDLPWLLFQGLDGVGPLLWWHHTSVKECLDFWGNPSFSCSRFCLFSMVANSLSGGSDIIVLFGNTCSTMCVEKCHWMILYLVDVVTLRKNFCSDKHIGIILLIQMMDGVLGITQFAMVMWIFIRTWFLTVFITCGPSQLGTIIGKLIICFSAFVDRFNGICIWLVFDFSPSQTC